MLPTPSTGPSDEAERCESRITIDFRPGFNDQDPRGSFVGKVNSDRASCERGRVVALRKQKPGKDKVVGRTLTNRRGKWRVSKAEPRGRYYAKVRRSTAGSTDNIICTGDRSKAIRAR